MDHISIIVQGTEHKISVEKLKPETTLNFYLRKILKQPGTKKMCLEGGCGACLVAAYKPDPTDGSEKLVAVNSCLVSILTCHNWRIETIESIGGPPEEYHPVQTTLANFNGTQCGYCSPGMVMNMYALYETGKLTMKEVENSFGGNLCRCTGYRPIMTAFKSLCKDACPKLLGTCPDIEDFTSNKIRPRCKSETEEWQLCQKMQSFKISSNDSDWIKVFNMTDLLAELSSLGSTRYMLVAGNTAKGVFQSPLPQVYIDVLQVEELCSYQIKNNNQLVLGANMSLTNAMSLFNNIGNQIAGFAYLTQMAKHIDLVANVPVRNMGTIAGNLMIKYQHNDFPSDIFLILETFEAQLLIVDCTGAQNTMSLREFLKCSMNQKVIKNVILKAISNDFKYVTYKIMPRAQNVHALVNAGFKFKLKSNIVQSASIVIGNINANFIHAQSTEMFLLNKNLFDNSTIQSALEILSNELVPHAVLPEPDPKFRKGLALALFYKAVLYLAPSGKVSPKLQSGATLLERPISTGVQDYDTNKSLYPLTQAIPKLEAQHQTSGRAEYVDDIPDLPYQLFAKFVYAKAPANSVIKFIDASKALALEGVATFFSKDDIPGDNNFFPKDLGAGVVEEIFCTGTVQYFDQVIGMIVAESEDIAEEAAGLVQITYTSSKTPPLITIRDVLKSGQKNRLSVAQQLKSKRKGSDVARVIKGSFEVGLQYHFHMETQCCLVVPIEDTLEVYPATQWMDHTQIAIARMLNISNAKVNIRVRRCGGGFGGKLSRTSQFACALSLAAWKLRKAVRMSLHIKENIQSIGKRYPFLSNYEVGVNSEGSIQYLNADSYSDQGVGQNEGGISTMLLANIMKSSYDYSTYDIKIYYTKTDTPANTYCRAPGHVEGMAFIENVMDHIACEMNLDPLLVRAANFNTSGEVPDFVSDLVDWAEIYQRKKEIIQFNDENRWKKKGLSVVPMRFDFTPNGTFSTTVSIYHGDGSVAITHGGIEIGQGINTKAAQVCAYRFGIPLKMISVRPSDVSVVPNCGPTGGSITTDAICYSTLEACNTLLQRLEPYKTAENDTWVKIVQAAQGKNVFLSASAMYSPAAPFVKPYPIYGACAAEVTLDVLTGQHMITRVDLLEDVGRTINPFVDIGQVEGAFVMGIGYYTSEEIICDSNGQILTNNTWYYHPPGAKDIPVDFRVKFPKNRVNPAGVLQSKAIGEPPICLSVCVPLAIRHAVQEAKKDANSTAPVWYPFSGPASVQSSFLNSMNDTKSYVL